MDWGNTIRQVAARKIALDDRTTAKMSMKEGENRNREIMRKKQREKEGGKEK